MEIRLPELTGGTEAEQLQKIRSYLYSLAEQLQYAFDGVAREQDRASGEVRTGNRAAGEKEAARDSFSAIKSLIIRSAEIAEHFEDQIEKRLEGKYVAQSQFGTFQQVTDQKITASSEQLRQDFSNLQQIESSLTEIRSTLLEVNACIRSGILYYRDSGEPVYGVEIGQQEWADGAIRFHKFARLTSDRLSFYDSNDVEVAYISDNRMYVTDASVVALTAADIHTGTLQIGDYYWQMGADGHLGLR